MPKCCGKLTAPKRAARGALGQGRPPAVDTLEESTGKLEAALAARRSEDFLVVGRTDAYAIHGLDEALRRARRFVEIGVDGVFATGITSVNNLRRVADTVDTLLMSALVEVGPFPKLTPAEFGELDYSLIVYTVTVILSAATAIRDALNGIRAERIDLPKGAMAYPECTTILGLGTWTDIELRYGAADRAGQKMMSVRRVVTGVDGGGHSRILSDTQQKASEGVPGLLDMTPLWSTALESIAVPLTGTDPTARGDIASLPAGSTIFSMVEFAPGDLAKSGRLDELASMGDLKSAMQKGGNKRHPAMHATTTIDYIYVLEGEITLILEVGETILRPGDILVQGGANHSWINHTDKPAKMLGVVVGAARPG